MWSLRAFKLKSQGLETWALGALEWEVREESCLVIKKVGLEGNDSGWELEQEGGRGGLGI